MKYRSQMSIVTCMILLILTFTVPVSGDWNPLTSIYNQLFPESEPPEITFPEDGHRFAPGDDILFINFSEVEDAEYYQIEFDLTDEFTDGYVLDSDVPNFDLSEYVTQSEWDDLAFSLYFRVNAVIDEEPTKWSIPHVFYKSNLYAPEIITPFMDSRFAPGQQMPVLSWTPLDGVSVYAIEFAEDQDFETTYGWFEFQGTTLDFNLSGDPEVWNPVQGTFYWRVWGMQYGNLPTQISETFYFSKTTIGSPSPDSPADHTRYPAYSDVPVLTWSPLNDSSEYHLQLVIGEDNFPPGVDYFVMNSTSMDFSDFGVTPQMWNKVYGHFKWRVATIDSFGNHGPFSSEFEFVKIADGRYMAYGDSVTGGYGSSTWGSGYAGYPPVLQHTLKNRYGSETTVICKEGKSWFGGGHAYMGDWKIESAMQYHGPSHVLIMFGTVDAIDTGAPGCEDHNCHVKDHLRNVIMSVRSYHAIPFLATLPPVNPESDRAFAQDLVDDYNADIRDLANETGVGLADLESAFFNSSIDLPAFFSDGDWAHFNDMGYGLIADTWASIL